MTRFLATIGFRAEAVETSPDVFESVINETEISGEMKYRPIRWTGGESEQTNIAINHVFNCIIPESTLVNLTDSVYIVWQGKRWAVAAVDIMYPRIFLTLGGLYNG